MWNGSINDKTDIRDNPEGSPTDNESLHDRFESEQTVDVIPIGKRSPFRSLSMFPQL
jgi:hypothetical protein